MKDISIDFIKEKLRHVLFQEKPQLFCLVAMKK